MERDISAEVAKLRSLGRRELLELWRKNYQKSPPPRMRRELLIPFLAFRIQENHYGGLKSSTRAALREIVRGLENKTKTRSTVRLPLKTGTRLYRQWDSVSHEVFVTDSGYEYHGAKYRSLSEIAGKITGTRWSGPAFFGLKKTASQQGSLDE